MADSGTGRGAGDAEDIDAEDIEAVIASLEVAATAGDLTEPFFAEYRARCADSAAAMDHMDQQMRGRMLAGLYDLLLIPDAAEQSRYMAFELGNHEAYGAKPHMYAPLFAALLQVVRQACGAAWSPVWAAAWDRRVAALMAEVEAQA